MYAYIYSRTKYMKKQFIETNFIDDATIIERKNSRILKCQFWLQHKLQWESLNLSIRVFDEVGFHNFVKS